MAMIKDKLNNKEYSGHLYCKKCKSHDISLVYNGIIYYVKCDECDFESPVANNPEDAMENWDREYLRR